ncbi:MAG: Mur ligase domain-containing protein [Erysipelotrichaceae bacterium]|nr:Mur ligase domain-containing protein [Erysipelotrichaceae bacterium]
MNRNLSDYFPDAPSIEFMDVKTSSNEIQPHDLFVCIQGVSVDRHDFLPQAALANAAGAIVSKDVNTPLPVYKVANPNETLVELVKKAILMINFD